MSGEFGTSSRNARAVRLVLPRLPPLGAIDLTALVGRTRNASLAARSSQKRMQALEASGLNGLYGARGGTGGNSATALRMRGGGAAEAFELFLDAGAATAADDAGGVLAASDLGGSWRATGLLQSASSSCHVNQSIQSKPSPRRSEMRHENQPSTRTAVTTARHHSAMPSASTSTSSRSPSFGHCQPMGGGGGDVSG